MDDFPLRISPQNIEFDHVRCNIRYISRIVVRNTSNKTVRFKIKPPSLASSFTLLYKGDDVRKICNPTIALSPGLCIEYDVAFVVNEQFDEGNKHPLDNLVNTASSSWDNLQVKIEDGRSVNVCLKANSLSLNVEITPSLCDLGKVVLNSRASRAVEIRNLNDHDTTFTVSLVSPDANSFDVNSEVITIAPRCGILRPFEHLPVKVEIFGRELGPLRRLLCVRFQERQTNIPSASFVDKVVDLAAVVMEHTIDLLYANPDGKLLKCNEPLKAVCFGSIFAGEGQSVNAILRNNGPKPLSFYTSITSNRSSDQLGDEDGCGNCKLLSATMGKTSTAGINPIEKGKEIRVAPSRGVIDPFVEIPIHFILQSRVLDFEAHNHAVQRALRQCAEQDNGSEPDSVTRRTNLLVELSGGKFMNAFVSFRFGDSTSRGSVEDLTLGVSAEIFVPILEVSPLLSSYNFGTVECHGHRDMILTIKNHSRLATRLSFVRPPHFSIHPSTLWLESLQSQSIILSFAPKQLGIFKKEIMIDIQGGIFQLKLFTQGQSSSSVTTSENFYTKQTGGDLLSGTQAHLQNVKPTYKFIHSDDILRAKIKNESRFHRLPLHKRLGSENTAPIILPESNQHSHLSFSVKEFVQRSEHRERYHRYLVHSRLDRDRKNKSVHYKSLETDDYIDLGMIPQGGMKAPEIDVPRFIKELNSSVYLSARSPTNQQETIEGRNKAHTSFDEEKFIIKKYKSKPTTANEMKECEETLDTEQLDHVISGPNVIYFGKMSVNSSSIRSFTVFNDLQQHIKVTLHLGSFKPDTVEKSNDLVARSNLDSQVIPPHTVAGFDLVYSSSREQVIHKPLTYTINGKHTRQLSIMAEVVPLDVLATPCTLHFEFALDDVNRTLERPVLLDNLSNSKAPFVWHHMKTELVENPNRQINSSLIDISQPEKKSSKVVPCPFQIHPSSGTLNQKESLQCMFTYVPTIQAQSTFQTTFELEIIGGRRTRVFCSATNKILACAVIPKTVDFGDVQVGVRVEKSILLRNESDHDGSSSDAAEYSFLVAYTSIHPVLQATSLSMRVTPSILSLGARECKEIRLEMTGISPAEKVKNALLYIEIRGGMTLQIPVLANFVVPDVKIQSDQITQNKNNIEYGNVVAGGIAHRVLPLKNFSEVKTSLLLDLSSLESATGISERRFSEFSAEVRPHPIDEAMSYSLDPIQLQEKRGLTSMYKISIQGKSAISIDLRFAPVENETNTYNMVPVHIFFTSACQNTATLLSKRVPYIKFFVSAKSICPRIAFSSSIVDFGTCLIPREPSMRRCSFTKSLLIRNKESSFIKWYIDIKNLRSSGKYSKVFHMAPENGDLAPLEENVIQFSFHPLKDEMYHFEGLTVYVDNDYYMDLELHGHGQFPHIEFSLTECDSSNENAEKTRNLTVNLPPVPLQMTSSAVFWIVNHGYEHLELLTRVRIDTNSVPLLLTFPEGNVLNQSCLRLPVVISFTASKGIAFETEIDFLDQNGHTYGIRATGVTENSIWTNFTFFQHQTVVDSRPLLFKIQDIICKKQDPTQAALLISHIESLGAFVPNKMLTGKNQGKLFGFFSNPTYRNSNIQMLSVEQIQAELLSCLDASFPGIADQHHKLQESSKENSRPRNSMNLSVAAILHSEAFSTSETQRLINYLNRNVFHQYKIRELPLDLVENERIWTDIGKFCFGSSPPLDFPVPPASFNKPSDSMTAWLTFYRSIVQFLRSKGAMLPDINPVDLLPFDLFMKAKEKGIIEPTLVKRGDLKTSNQVARRGFTDSKRDISKNVCSSVSQRSCKLAISESILSQWNQTTSLAWMKLIYQILKIFVLFRLEPHPLIKRDTSNTASSNVYSNGELMLLEWVQSSIGSLPGYTKQSNLLILDFNKDFRDGKILFHLLVAYIPSIRMDAEEYRCFSLPEKESEETITYGSLKADTTRPEDKVVKILESLDLDYGLRVAAEEEGEAQITQENTALIVPVISSLNGREIVLLLLHLYKHLPEYLPKEVIKFEGRCGELIEKCMELRNANATGPVVYNVRMQSITDVIDKLGVSSECKCGPFSIPITQVTLAPHQVLSFLVQCQSHFVRKESAILIFQPTSNVSADSSGRPAPLVFQLETSIQYRTPQRMINIEGRLYEKISSTIEIENPFDRNTDFKLYLLESTPSSSALSTQCTRVPTKKKQHLRSFSEIDPKNDVDTEGCLKSQAAFYLPEMSASAILLKSKALTLKQVLLAPQSIAPSAVTLAMRSKASEESVSPLPSTYQLQLDFLPLQLGDYTCYLIFIDEHVGEFMIRVDASTHMPAPLETIEVTLEPIGYPDGSNHFQAHKIVRELIFPQRNAILSKAIGALLERNNTYLQWGVGFQKSRLRDSLMICEEQHHQCQQFSVNFDSPHFKPVPSSTVSTTKYGDDEAKMVSRVFKSHGKSTLARIVAPRSTMSSGDCSTQSITFSIEPKSPGRLSTILSLQSLSLNAPCQGSCDCRVYEIIVNVKEPSMHTILEFITPARQKTVQEIPIKNSSTEVWSLEAKFTSSTTRCMFSGPPTLIVPSKQTVMYPLTFAPQQTYTKKLSETTSLLTITNKNTSQIFEFRLRGKIEIPLAQDCIVVNCAAQNSVVLEIFVPRVPIEGNVRIQSQRYDVDSDIPQIVGEPTLLIPAHAEKARYELTFSPLRSGKYLGTITFTSVEPATGEIVWYTFEAVVSRPKPRDQLEMVTKARTPIGVEITLANPLPHAVTFAVKIEQELQPNEERKRRDLSGDSTMTISAHDSGVYSLVYTPLRETNSGTSKTFSSGEMVFENEEIGEFWYRLLLQATASDITRLNSMCCKISSNCSEPLLLQNPSAHHDMHLRYTISNPTHFALSKSPANDVNIVRDHITYLIEANASISVPRCCQTTIFVIYKPSVVDEREFTEITFFEPDFVTDWKFQVEGKCTASENNSISVPLNNPFITSEHPSPISVQYVLIQAHVGEPATKTVDFANPYDDPLTLSIKLLGPDQEKSLTFELLLKRKDFTVRASDSIQIPITFTPRHVCRDFARLIINGSVLSHSQEVMSKRMNWEFNIEGVAEFSIPKPFLLSCSARKEVTETFDCKLYAAPRNVDIEKESFSVDWDIPQDTFPTVEAFKNALTLHPQYSHTQTSQELSSNIPALSYQVHFHPFRPYHGNIALIITKASGGKWRYEVSISVLDPPVDETFTLEASLNQTSSFQFQLQNFFRKPADCIATFDKTSSSVFSVYPEHATLPAHGMIEHCTFVVSFTPTTYGKMQSGTLIILTNEMQWTFRVKGTFASVQSVKKSKRSKNILTKHSRNQNITAGDVIKGELV